jgi:hypothetical protein
MKKIFFVILMISLVCSEAGSQPPGLNQKTQSEKGFFSRIFGKGKNSPSAAGKSKKKQAAAKRKQKKEWNKYVKKSQQRAYDIQTTEVKARMKQNKKDITARDKAKKKQIRKSTKKAGQKYS